jgi:radical SAM/Cys-rich protein
MNDIVGIEAFSQRIKRESIILNHISIDTLQINIGKLCNQVCTHCHVGAGPAKTRENMKLETVEKIIELVKKSKSIKTVDITGGAPELNPHFRMLVEELVKIDVQTIDRCNLTVLSEPGQEDTPEFLAKNHVQVVASLPCYSSENVDKQRGDGVFAKSITGLKKLNAVGYAKEGSSLSLDLVYNPQGPHLPPAQSELKAQYATKLNADFGIQFNDLFCITNLPVKRFKDDLERSGQLEAYMSLLEKSFNVTAANNVMCKNLVSISWDGKIFDCDFNQMLEMPINYKNKTIFELDNFNELQNCSIALANHCYGCTAGAGSSCGGTTAN